MRARASLRLRAPVRRALGWGLAATLNVWTIACAIMRAARRSLVTLPKADGGALPRRDAARKPADGAEIAAWLRYQEATCFESLPRRAVLA